MYRILCSLFFVALVSVSVSVPTIHCTAPSAPFYKNGNSYESIFGNYSAGAPAPAGYFESMQEVLKKYHESSATLEDLNKFGYGLDQLFTFRFLQKYYEEEISKHEESSNSNPEFVKVSDYTDSSGLIFKDLVVYGFPLFKKGAKVEPTHDALNSAVEYQVTARYKSDTTILTGSFYLADSKYFFVYHLKSPFCWISLRVKRNPEEFVFVKRALAFDEDQFVHTYDSSYDNATEIITILKDSLTNRLLPHVAYELSLQRNWADFKHQIYKKELSFVQQYYKSILNVLLQSASEYVKSKVQANGGNDIFDAEPLVFDLSSGAPQQYQQKVNDIKLKGFLNYVGTPELVYDNTSISDNGRLFNMSQGVKFNYAQDGDKQATINFVLSLRNKEFPKQYKVQSITIISEYLGDLTKKPLEVYRNKDVFINKAGFLIRFETYEENLEYFYVLRHLGGDIARTIQRVVESSG